MTSASSAASGQRLASLWDAAKSSIGFPTGVAIALGLIAGFGVPAIDSLLVLDLPVFSFTSLDDARGLLETLGTVTVAVAGISFSVTVVAFTLAANQLSPRVLRSFRTDRLVQLTLATLIGTFIYCLVVLVRLGAVEEGAEIPNLSVTLAVILAIACFSLFAAFIAHIVTMLQPSSVIAAISDDAREALRGRYPQGIGAEPDHETDPERAVAHLPKRAFTVEATDHGYLTLVVGGPLVGLATEHDAVIRQVARIGGYVLPGEPLAAVWAEEPEQIADRVREAFVLGRQRTFVQDTSFAVRQLADIALKGLSPGINDPTTALNAIEAMTGVIIEFTRSEAPSPVRVDGDGTPRFLAELDSLDDLVRIGFEQLRGFAAEDPVLARSLPELLDRLRLAAEQAHVSEAEIQRQARLLGEAGRA